MNTLEGVHHNYSTALSLTQSRVTIAYTCGV
jgi:hypothetical protein